MTKNDKKGQVFIGFSKKPKKSCPPCSYNAMVVQNRQYYMRVSAPFLGRIKSGFTLQPFGWFWKSSNISWVWSTFLKAIKKWSPSAAVCVVHKKVSILVGSECYFSSLSERGVLPAYCWDIIESIKKTWIIDGSGVDIVTPRSPHKRSATKTRLARGAGLPAPNKIL